MPRATKVISIFVVTLFANGHFARAEAPQSGSASDSVHRKEARPYHPEPRVIVNVLEIKGPHDPARVQHDARFGWKRIVGCYKKHSPHEKVQVTLDLVVTREGSLARALNVRADTANHDLERCLADRLPGLSMPKASANSRANLEIKLAPGDPPGPK